MSNTDRLSPTRRIHSVRRHAAYVCQIRRDSGRTHARKSSLANVTEAALRKSIIEILSHSQEEAALAANELAETMDSVFFTKGAGAAASVTSRTELAPPADLIASDITSLHTGYPAKCVTVVTHEHERSPSNHATPTRARRKPLLVMEKLSKRRQQKSVPDMAPRKSSTGDESTVSHRSKGLTSKLSRAVLRSRKPSNSTTSSDKRDSRPPSRLSGTLSSFGSSLKQSFSLNRTTDMATSTISTPMLDSEMASYEQIVYQKHDVGVAFPLIDSPMAHVEQDLTPFRDSAYYSKASDASEDCLAAGSAHASYSTPKRPNTTKGVSVSTLSPALTPPVLRTPLTPHTPLTPSYTSKLRSTSASPSPADYHLSPPPPLRRPALHHSSSLPILTLNTTLPKTTSATTTYTSLSARRPRFDRFLSTTSMWSDAASSSYSHSPTTSKPPSPLRERPFLDLKRKEGHKRVLSSGSRTESIRIYLDEEDEDEDEEGDEEGAKVDEEMQEGKGEGVQWTEVQWKKPLDTETAAQQAIEELKATTAATGSFPLSSPQFRTALAVDEFQTSSSTTLVDGDEEVEEPLTLAPLTFKKPPTPITRQRNYPDVPYAPHPSPPGNKWYDIHPAASSRQPTWEGPWTRRCHGDEGLLELFQEHNFTQAGIARKVVKRGVGRADGASASPTSPLERAVSRGEAYREEGQSVRKSVEGYLEQARNDAAEGGGIGLAL